MQTTFYIFNLLLSPSPLSLFLSPSLPPSLIYLIIYLLFSELREAFRFLDINGDGTVSVYELRTIIHSLGHFPSTDELRQVLKDHNITGKYNFIYSCFQWLLKF